MQKIFKKILLVLCSMSVLIFGTSCEIVSNNGNSNQEEIQALEIVDSNGVNNQGVLTVTGDVKNISGQNLKKIVITVKFYNSSKEEIATGQDISEDLLLPDETYHFKVNCLKKDASSYDITAEAYA